MSKYNFSFAQRYAVYHAFKGICQWSNEHVEFKNFDVDHVLPETLLKDPVKLAEVKESFKLDDGFNINDYENWVVLHPSWNSKKSDAVFKGAPVILTLLKNCAKKKPIEQKIQLRLEREVNATKVMALIEGAIKNGLVDMKTIEDFILGANVGEATDQELKDIAEKLERDIEYQSIKMTQKILREIELKANSVLNNLKDGLGEDWVASRGIIFGGNRLPGVTEISVLANKYDEKYAIKVSTNAIIIRNELIIKFFNDEGVIDGLNLDVTNGVDWNKYTDKLYQLFKERLPK